VLDEPLQGMFSSTQQMFVQVYGSPVLPLQTGVTSGVILLISESSSVRLG